jgi:hypothetical protein
MWTRGIKVCCVLCRGCVWAVCDCGCACVPVAWSASISWLVSGVVKATDPMEKVLKLRQTLKHFCDAATRNEHIGNCAESVCMTSSVWAVAVIRLSCVKRIMINAQETPLPAGLTGRKRYTPLRSGCSENAWKVLSVRCQARPVGNLTSHSCKSLVLSPQDPRCVAAAAAAAARTPAACRLLLLLLLLLVPLLSVDCCYFCCCCSYPSCLSTAAAAAVAGAAARTPPACRLLLLLVPILPVDCCCCWCCCSYPSCMSTAAAAAARVHPDQFCEWLCAECSTPC